MAPRSNGGETGMNSAWRFYTASFLSFLTLIPAFAAGLMANLGIGGYAEVTLCGAVSLTIACIASALDKHAAGLYLAMLPIVPTLLTWRICFIPDGEIDCSPGVLPWSILAITSLVFSATLVQLARSTLRTTK